MIEQGLYPKTLDVTRGYTLAFVDHGVGLNLKPKAP